MESNYSKFNSEVDKKWNHLTHCLGPTKRWGVNLSQSDTFADIDLVEI